MGKANCKRIFNWSCKSIGVVVSSGADELELFIVTLFKFKLFIWLGKNIEIFENEFIGIVRVWRNW